MNKHIAVIGASGFVGTALLRELLQRGHRVTAIVRKPDGVTIQDDRLTVRQGDATDTQALAQLLQGHDAIISAYNAGWTNPNLYQDFLDGSLSIESAAAQSGVKRLIVIGGAGSLYAAPGVQIVDTPEFPEAYKAGATAARDYLNILKENNTLDWTFFSPAIEMNPATSGERTGRYRTGLEEPVFNEAGRSQLSVEDLAVAIADEVEAPKHIRQRFTAGY